MNYTFETISSLAIAGMITSGIVSLVVPLVALIIWYKKTKARISSFFIGCAVFILFALVLESAMHNLVFKLTGNTITGNIWLYALYGGLAAGVFEETGRFVAMKFCMKNCLDKKNSIMYGFGHGGIEAVLVCTVTEISNIVTSFAINAGGLDTILNTVTVEETKNDLYVQLSQLWTLDGGIFFAAGVERISAMTFHVCASYIVYKAIADKKISKYFIAILLHMILDALTLLLNESGCPIWGIEAIVAACSAALLVYVVRDYRKRITEVDAVEAAA